MLKTKKKEEKERGGSMHARREQEGDKTRGQECVCVCRWWIKSGGGANKKRNKENRKKKTYAEVLRCWSRKGILLFACDACILVVSRNDEPELKKIGKTELAHPTKRDSPFFSLRAQ